MEQLKGGSTRIVTEPQKPRAVSPFQLPRYGIGGASLKSETNQRSNDDSRSLEVKENIFSKKFLCTIILNR